jgi:hypothetical protein
MKRRSLAVILGGAALLVASPAEAVEHQWHAGVDFGYMALFDPTAHGYGGGLHLRYGLTDMFDLMGQVDVSAHPYRQWLITSGGVGAAYVVDVLQWVPYVGAVAGAAGVFSTDPACGISSAVPCRSFRINLEIPFGLDYQVSRRFSVGVAGRFQLLLLGESPWMLLGAFARAEYVWGF